MNSENLMDEVRLAPDGRVSVYDAIAFATGHKNPRDTWRRLLEKYPELADKCDDWQFPGRGQRKTPVADLSALLEILAITPSRFGMRVRSQAIQTLTRALSGDASLVEEIVGRIRNPQDLKRIELATQAAQSTRYLNAKIRQHGGVSNEIINGQRLNTYAQVANLNNRSLRGMNARQIRQFTGVKHTRNAFSNTELARISFQENLEAKALDTRQAKGHFEILETVSEVLTDLSQLVQKYSA